MELSNSRRKRVSSEIPEEIYEPEVNEKKKALTEADPMHVTPEPGKKARHPNKKKSTEDIEFESNS